LGRAEWPTVRNRTPDDPAGARPLRLGMPFKSPPVRETTGPTEREHR
jgi:hypothetical protein